MQSLLEYIVERISSRNLLHAKKLKNNIRKADEGYFIKANLFLEKYESLLQNENKTIDFVVDCYLNLLAYGNY